MLFLRSRFEDGKVSDNSYWRPCMNEFWGYGESESSMPSDGR